MNTPESPEIARLQQRLSDMEARYQRYQEMFPGAINRIDELDREVEALRAEVRRLRDERASLLRCSKDHIHNQIYGRPCPICERDALREGMERLIMAAQSLTRNPDSWEDLNEALSAAQAILSGAENGEPPDRQKSAYGHEEEKP